MEGVTVRGGTNLLGQAACVRAFPRDLRKSFGAVAAQHSIASGFFVLSFCLALFVFSSLSLQSRASVVLCCVCALAFAF
jgi:hypothetical protein